MIFEQVQAVPVRRAALTAVVALGAVAGVIPYTIFLGRYRVAVVVGAAVLAAAVAARRLWRAESRATEQPNPGEMLMGAWSIALYSAVVSLWGILSYYLAWLTVQLGGGFLGLYELSARATELLAVRVSLGLTALSAVAAFGLATRELVAMLYPATAGARSPFYALIVEKRRLVALILGTASLAALAALLLRDQPRWLATAILVVLLYTSATLDVMGSGGGDSRSKHRSLRGLERIFEVAGYETVVSPRTGMSEVDPLITTVDLLATAPGSAWVVEVKAVGKDPVEWHEASRLRNAAYVMQEMLAADEPAVRVEPLLVLAGRPRGESLDRYLERESMSVIEVDGAELQAAGGGADESEPGALAARLGIERPPAGRTVAARGEGA